MTSTAHKALPLRAERGTTLLEALIAFLVLSIGILTVGRVQSHLRLGSDIARQRSEAVRLGQEELESLRGFAVAAASSGMHSYAEIASAAATIDAAGGYATHTSYRLQRDVESSADGDSKAMAVTVTWAACSKPSRCSKLNPAPDRPLGSHALPISARQAAGPSACRPYRCGAILCPESTRQPWNTRS